MQFILILFVVAIGVFISIQFVNTIPDNNDDGTTSSSTKKTYSDVITDAKDAISVSTGASVDLSDKGLTSVPMDIFDKTNVEIVNLSDNNLTGSLPAEVRHLQNLRSLDLSNNNFTGVPAEIGRLSKLEVLNLAGNPITGLPLELGNLKSLKVLDLRNTEYSTYDLDKIKENLPRDVVIKVS